MSYFVKKLEWAPVPTDEAVERQALDQLAKIRGGCEHSLNAFNASAADRKLKSLDLLKVVEEFNVAIAATHNERHYPQVCDPLSRTNGINCALLVNERMEKWDNARPFVCERDAVKRTLELEAVMHEVRAGQNVFFRDEKWRGVDSWASSVANRLRIMRMQAIKAVVKFPCKVLGKTIGLFLAEDPLSDADLSFLAALLHHEACDNHPSYGAEPVHRGKKYPVFNFWLNGLCHAIVENKPFADAKLVSRILDRFGCDAWRNCDLKFADNWELKVHTYEFHTLYVATDGWGFNVCPYDLFDHLRTMRLLNGILDGANVRALEALFAHDIVDRAMLRNVINMRMAIPISCVTYAPWCDAPYNTNLGGMPVSMRKFLFTHNLHKPAFRPPSMYLEPPIVADRWFDEIQDALLADLPPTRDQKRLTSWDNEASYELSVFKAFRRGRWETVREAHVLRCAALYWSETALKKAYEAAMDEDGRPLMIGNIAAGDQKALGEAMLAGPSSASTGVDALDAAAAEAAKAKKMMKRPLCSKQEDDEAAENAKKVAASKRNLIAAREMRAAAEADMAKAGMAKAGMAKAFVAP